MFLELVGAESFVMNLCSKKTKRLYYFKSLAFVLVFFTSMFTSVIFLQGIAISGIWSYLLSVFFGLQILNLFRLVYISISDDSMPHLQKTKTEYPYISVAIRISFVLFVAVFVSLPLSEYLQKRKIEPLLEVHKENEIARISTLYKNVYGDAIYENLQKIQTFEEEIESKKDKLQAAKDKLTSESSPSVRKAIVSSISQLNAELVHLQDIYQPQIAELETKNAEYRANIEEEIAQVDYQISASNLYIQRLIIASNFGTTWLIVFIVNIIFLGPFMYKLITKRNNEYELRNGRLSERLIRKNYQEFVVLYNQIIKQSTGRNDIQWKSPNEMYPFFRNRERGIALIKPKGVLNKELERYFNG